MSSIFKLFTRANISRVLLIMMISSMVLLTFLAIQKMFPGIVTITHILETFVFFVTAGTIFLIIMERKFSSQTYSWMLVIIFIPLVGIILYMIFGRNIRKNKLFTKKELSDRTEIKSIQNYLNLEYKDANLFKTTLARKTAKLLYNNSKAFLSIHNQIEVYPDGMELFQQMLNDINNAKDSIHMEYFAFENNSVGKIFKNALIKKADQGVKIRIIIDDVGSWNFRFNLGKELTAHGVKCYYFNKVRIPLFNSHFNYRNHRKITIIDGKVGYLGGLNIGDKYASKVKYFGYWRDTHMRLHGGSVYSLQTVFLTDLYFTSGEYLFKPEYYPEIKIEKKIPMQIVTSGPDSDWASILQVYFTAITNAKRKIYITSPYLILNESISMALITAALSGVDVRIVVPGISDHIVVFWGSRSYYPELIEAGVKIYEYKKGFIHAKSMVVDTEIVSIGTANMDMRSFLQNFEINGLIYDKKIAMKVEKQLMIDMKNSKQVTAVDIKNITLSQQLKASLSRLFSPIM